MLTKEEGSWIAVIGGFWGVSGVFFIIDNRKIIVPSPIPVISSLSRLLVYFISLLQMNFQ